MGFQPVSNRVSFPELEQQVLEFWKEKDIFNRSVEGRKGGPVYTLYEGPPTANGRPGIHHVLARVFKDVMPRFKAMQGYYAPRKGGWDTHGLPVELGVEEELGLHSKREIESYGIEKFNAKCRESVFRYVKDWELLTERIGFWVDMRNPYVTLNNDYMESGWWIFKQLWDQELVYKGYKVTPHCPRCVTSLSSHEVALGYREDTPDPSVHVKLKVRSSERARAVLPPLEVPTFFLAWTTTPWTLPANVALAVAPGARYVVAEGSFGLGGAKERLILAEALAADTLEQPFQVLETVSGEDLVGLQYEPLFRFVEPVKPAHRIIGADFVSLQEGTGMVHIAPAYGAEDLEVGRTEDLPTIHTVTLDGAVIDVPGAPYARMFIKDADPLITEELRRRGLLYRSGTIHHTYPFCWRCDTPLIYYAKDSWYIRTTARKDRLVQTNREIDWHPDYIKDGRFGEWLENNVDWALSRERYWGTPIPVWTCDHGHQRAIGSVRELWEQDGVQGLSGGMDLHRPFIDGVTFRCADCGSRMSRVPEVMDAWYDSGAMPVSQWHYPFDNEALFRTHFPADYICEAVDQTRGWFYTLHALAVLLFDRPSYQHVVSLGHILDEKGEKMSKSRGNVVEPWTVLNTRGADATRWYMYTATAPGNPRRFSEELVGDAVRRFLLPLWNTYSFFVTYANLDGFDPSKGRVPDMAQRSHLDRWLVSALQGLVEQVTREMEDYNMTEACRAIEGFVEDLSNWYVRRSRRRFWKSGDDADKQAAYHTLYEALTTLSRLLAPFTPFVADQMYRNLVVGVDARAPESVHLADWPKPRPELRDEQSEDDVRLAIRLASLGRAARSKAAIKVRQPLAEALVLVPGAREKEALARIADQLRDELNVKTITPVEDESAFMEFSIRPNLPVLGPRYGRELGRVIGELNKMNPARVAERVRAGLSVDVDGKTLAPHDLLVDAKAKGGLISATDGTASVAVETAVTAELAQEGMARELVRHLQELRRTAGFDVSDRIIAYVAGDREVGQVLQHHGPYIMNETLAVALRPEHPPRDAHAETVDWDGTKVTLGVEKVEKG